jgi:hypothetical protein
MILIKKCRHPNATVKCEHKEWIFIVGKKKTVRICNRKGACIFEKKKGGIND